MIRLTSELEKLRKTAQTPKIRRRLQGVLFACAGFLLGFGLLRGEAAVVLKKAVHVCLECIGIG